MWQLVLRASPYQRAQRRLPTCLGTLGAWYETQVLLGSLRVGPVIAASAAALILAVRRLRAREI